MGLKKVKEICKKKIYIYILLPVQGPERLNYEKDTIFIRTILKEHEARVFSKFKNKSRTISVSAEEQGESLKTEWIAFQCRL